MVSQHGTLAFATLLVLFHVSSQTAQSDKLVNDLICAEGGLVSDDRLLAALCEDWLVSQAEEKLLPGLKTADATQLSSDNQASLAEQKQKRKNEFIRLGKRKYNFIRLGRSSPAASHELSDIGRPKRKYEFVRLGRSADEAHAGGIDKRKQEFIRFGKRKQEFIRFGKRKQEFIRFGKRKNEFVRLG